MSKSSLTAKLQGLTLRTRMVLLFGGGTALILVLIQLAQLFGLPFINFLGAFKQQEKIINTDTRIIADHQKNLISLWFNERLGDMQVLSNQGLIIGALEQKSDSSVSEQPASRQELQALLQHMELIRSAYGIYDVINIIEAEGGTSIASTNTDTGKTRHPLADDIFTTGTFSISPRIIFKKLSSNTPSVLFLAAPVLSEKTFQPIGAVIAQISTVVLLEQLLTSEQSLGASGEIVLIDMDKRLLAPLKHPLADGSQASPLEYTLTTRAAEFAAWGVDSLIETEDYRGIPVIAAVRHLRLTEDFAISMIVNRNKADLYGPVWDNLLISLIVSLLGICGVIAVSLAVARQLARPLEQLSMVSSAIKQGDLSARVQPLKGLEARSLASAFNTMADTLENSQSNLKREVSSRTEALQRLSIRQDAILSAVPDILVEINRELKFSWTNRNALLFFGDDLIDRPTADFCLEEDTTGKEISVLFDDSERVLIMETSQRRVDGSTRVLAWRCKAIINEKRETTSVLATARDITERKWAEIKLQKSQERFRDLLNCIPDLVWLKDIDGIYLACNLAFQRFFGAGEGEIVGKTDYDFVSRELADFFREHDQYAIDKGSSASNEEWVTFAGESEPTLLYTTKTPMYESNGVFIGVLGVGRDITELRNSEEEKRRLQEQLQQAQKIESVGRLAGGVAHDFNNMLSVIIGHAELALGSLTSEVPVYDDLKEIKNAATRSASLTRQLLAYARKQAISPQVLDLNNCVEGMLNMLRRLIGENIELVWQPSKQPQMVQIDPTQLEQVLANLCINAKDAIPDTGNITISTNQQSFEEEDHLEHFDIPTGTYVTLTVADNGSGMSAEVRENIFEPFFTTKELGKGTGLGLATVYGVIKQNRGSIEVTSNQGKGTVFTIYLPIHLETAGDDKEKDEKEQEARGSETILIIEDEPTLLKLATRMLTQSGYTVHGATNAATAIEHARRNKDELQLIITDVIMPEMNGRELATNLQKIIPGCQCLFMSGYTADVIAHHGVLEKGVNFIQKPFSSKDLNRKVREILDNMP